MAYFLIFRVLYSDILKLHLAWILFSQLKVHYYGLVQCVINSGQSEDSSAIIAFKKYNYVHSLF